MYSIDSNNTDLNCHLNNTDQKVLIFVNYKIDNLDFINCYYSSSIIQENDFLDNRESFDMLCITLVYKNDKNKEMNEYITNYVKKFRNQRVDLKLTYYQILLNYPYLKKEMLKKDSKIIEIHKHEVKELSLIDFIN